MDSHTRFMEQAFTNPYTGMEWKCTTTEEIERIIKIPQNYKLVRIRRDIHEDSKNKLPFYKFSNKLHM